MEELVSIITPAYNASPFITKTIESVKNQTYQNWELIIVNDCSSDDTEMIINNEIKRDKRIKLISLESNKGVVNARNTGLAAGKGRFVAFLDSDDVWVPTKLEIQIDRMIKNKWPLSYTQYSLINSEGKELNKIVKSPMKISYKDLFKGSNIGCLTVVVDREMTGDFKMPDVRHEDYATWLTLLKDGTDAHGIDMVLAKYRKTYNSLSGNKIKAAQWQWAIYREFLEMSFIQSVYYFCYYTLNGIKKSFN